MIRRLWARLVDHLAPASPRRRPLRPPRPSPPALPPPSGSGAYTSTSVFPAFPCQLGPFSLRHAQGAGDESLLLAAFETSFDHDPELAHQNAESRQSAIAQAFVSRQRSYPLDFPGVQFFLLEYQGLPAGRLYLQMAATHWFIVDLVLMPACRQQGHGTAMLQQIIQLATAAGKPVRLHVAKSNLRAHALYRRLGFQELEELPRHYLLEHRGQS